MAGGVSLISTSSVLPFSTPPSLEVIELLPWDLQLLPVSPIQKGLLFLKPRPPPPSGSFTSLVLDSLRISLSRTLDHFPLLAGRFHLVHHNHGKSSFSVVCNNAGAEFVHAVAGNVTVSAIIDPLYVPQIVDSFFPQNGALNDEGVSKPLLAVQVTELADGFFIGMTMNHSVADGHSFWMFFNSWSEISRSGTDKISLTPSFHRSIKFPLIIPYRPGMNPSAPVAKTDFPKMEQSFFHFSREQILSLKEKANVETSNTSRATISSLQAVLAHFWRSLVRCQGLDANELAILVVAIGARPRLGPLLGEGYFGNAVQFTAVSAKKEQLIDGGLGRIAVEINKVIAQYTKDKVENYHASWIENPLFIGYPTNTKWDESKTITSSSPRFNVYGNDFGWGKPVAVRSGPGNKRYSKATLFPGAEEGSIDIEAYLLHTTLSAIVQDKEFMEIVSVPAM